MGSHLHAPEEAKPYHAFRRADVREVDVVDDGCGCARGYIPETIGAQCACPPEPRCDDDTWFRTVVRDYPSDLCARECAPCRWGEEPPRAGEDDHDNTHEPNREAIDVLGDVPGGVVGDAVRDRSAE